jgi:EAL domain-containing protein (putative c-di-GMP-specific phosphodiesterase class I)
VLKIDGGFVENIVDDPRCRAAIGTVLELARQMRVDCVIEGIESAQQALHASRLGGRLMQGFLFGRPSSAERAMQLFQAELMSSPSLPIMIGSTGTHNA